MTQYLMADDCFGEIAGSGPLLGAAVSIPFTSTGTGTFPSPSTGQAFKLCINPGISGLAATTEIVEVSLNAAGVMTCSATIHPHAVGEVIALVQTVDVLNFGLSGEINVLDCGVGVGCGVHAVDDAAITVALARVNPGGTVYFAPPPSGQYQTAGDISVPAYTTVRADAWSGAGNNAILHLINGSGASCVIGSESWLATSGSPSSDPGVIIKHMSIDVNGANNPLTHGIVVCGLHALVEHNFVKAPGQAGIVQADCNNQGN